MDIVASASAHTFDTIVGQDLVKRFLLRAGAQGRLPQALLFCGPAGVGKRSVMYALAKHLVTREFEPDSDAARRARGKVERGTHPDVLVVAPRSASGQILTEQVEEMHDRAYYAPLESPIRVIMIAPVEAMNPSASNKVLKLLEEPPPALRILLACEQIHRTLTTVQSRCALLRCPPVEFEPLAEWLIAIARCPRRRAETAARLSGGRPGVALELVSGENQERRRRICAELDFFEQEGYPSIFRVGHNLLDVAGGAGESISALLYWFRDLLVAALAGAAMQSAEAEEGGVAGRTRAAESLLINCDLTEEVTRAASRHSVRGLARALEEILKRNKDGFRPFVDPDLLLNVLLTNVGIALKS
ncbi:MAG TPA: hypothetical protein VM492_10400 [Sumerlaeia bacterium]|nr:hypothetical protein [Sumerlaeia bacterium]